MHKIIYEFTITDSLKLPEKQICEYAKEICLNEDLLYGFGEKYIIRQKLCSPQETDDGVCYYFEVISE